MSNRTMKAPSSASKVLAARWRCRLESIPSIFAQLVYMARLRDNYGHYRDREIADLSSRHATDKLLGESHVRVFRTWLSMTLKEQFADLRLYRDSLSPTARLWGIPWVQLCAGLIPQSATGSEIRLFVSTLEAVAMLSDRQKVIEWVQ